MEAFYWVLIYFAAFDILFLLLNQATFKNISILDSIFSANRSLFYAVLASWLLAVPIGAVFGIHIAKLVGRREPVIFQVATVGSVE